MKKTFGLFLIIVLAISFAACTAPQAEPVEQAVEKETEQPAEQEPATTPEPQEEQQELAAEDGDNAAQYSKILQSDAKKLMDEQDPLVIDVREDYEYEEKHIVGAILSPLGNIQNDITNLTDDKDALILIYCRSGNRSRTATEILVDIGYTNVHDFGGIIDWTYETE